jgi:hypothetical protein
MKKKTKKRKPNKGEKINPSENRLDRKRNRRKKRKHESDLDGPRPAGSRTLAGLNSPH